MYKTINQSVYDYLKSKDNLMRKDKVFQKFIADKYNYDEFPFPNFFPVDYVYDEYIAWCDIHKGIITTKKRFMILVKDFTGCWDIYSSNVLHFEAMK